MKTEKGSWSARLSHHGKLCLTDWERPGGCSYQMKSKVKMKTHHMGKLKYSPIHNSNFHTPFLSSVNKQEALRNSQVFSLTKGCCPYHEVNPNCPSSGTTFRKSSYSQYEKRKQYLARQVFPSKKTFPWNLLTTKHECITKFDSTADRRAAQRHCLCFCNLQISPSQFEWILVSVMKLSGRTQAGHCKVSLANPRRGTRGTVQC